MIRILLVDDELDSLRNLRQQLAENQPDWVLEGAYSGSRALEKIHRGPFDVVVADLAMPGMDGVALLQEVSRLVPGAVRIILSGQSDWATNVRLMGPAHQYVTKPCDPKTLAEIVERSLALRDRLADARLKLLVGQVQALPSIPSLYLELLELLRSDLTSADKVAQVVAQDLAMCAKMLQLVNSAFFGLPQPVVNPQEAVIYLGVDTIKSLVLSLQVFSLFERVHIPDFSFQELWQHSWETGVLAKRIAEVELPEPALADHAFTAGLLHDLGKLMLATGLPKRYQKVVETQHAQHKPASEAELELLGSTHAEVGAYLLGLWGLPDAVIEAVAMHHHPAQVRCPMFCAVTAVHAANALIHEHAAEKIPPDLSLDKSYLDHLGLQDRLTYWREQVVTAEPGQW